MTFAMSFYFYYFAHEKALWSLFWKRTCMILGFWLILCIFDHLSPFFAYLRSRAPQKVDADPEYEFDRFLSQINKQVVLDLLIDLDLLINALTSLKFARPVAWITYIQESNLPILMSWANEMSIRRASPVLGVVFPLCSP